MGKCHFIHNVKERGVISFIDLLYVMFIQT